MSILSEFEDRIAHAVEGVFAGVFRSRVQPAELAKALGREMDRRRVVGVGKIYAPNLFTIVISPADEQHLGSFTETLAAELATYLVGYSREKGYSLEQRPFVRFRVHNDLKLGRFEVLAELVSATELAEAAEEAGFYVPTEGAPPRDARTPPVASVPPVASAVPAERPRPGPGVTLPPSAIPAASAVAGRAEQEREPRTLRALSTVTVTGIEHDVVLGGERVVVGRSGAVDIRLADSNVSREHAAFDYDAGGWIVSDLGSTNGTFVNGEAVQRKRLRDGDVVSVGVSELVYHEPRG